MVKVKLLLMTVLTSFCVLSASKAFALTLPDPNSYIPAEGTSGTIYPVPAAIKYGDFYSYSLNLLENSFSLTNPGETNPYPIDATSSLSDSVVIGTFNNNKNVKENFDGMDNAFTDLPNGGTTPLWGMTAAAEPSQIGTVNNDKEGTWDANLSSLMGYLGRNDSNPLNNSSLVFVFDNNQTGAGDTQDLFGWGRIELVKPGAASKYFYFTRETSTPYSYPPDPFVSYANPGDYVRSPGAFTIPGTDITLNNNLGTNIAEFAFYSPDLDNLESWISNGYTSMSVEMRMAQLNNGGEQLFIPQNLLIERTGQPPVVPEPTTLFLFGTGVIGLAGAFRRKK